MKRQEGKKQEEEEDEKKNPCVRKLGWLFVFVVICNCKFVVVCIGLILYSPKPPLNS